MLPNDPDDAKLLSEVAGAKIDEVFIGSCMTNIGHFRAASNLLAGKRDIPVKLWLAPPTKMDRQELTREGHYGVFGAAGAKIEMPGCSLCMGNQARARRCHRGVHLHPQLPQPPGQNTNVYLASAELELRSCPKLAASPPWPSTSRHGWPEQGQQGVLVPESLTRSKSTQKSPGVTA